GSGAGEDMPPSYVHMRRQRSRSCFMASPLNGTHCMKRLLVLFALTIAASVYGGEWHNVAPGVDYQEFAEDTIDVYVARIDLMNDKIAVIGTRESEKGLKVSDYAKKNKAIVAIN